MSIELKTASGGSVTLVPEDGVSNVTATVKHESGVLASEAQVEQAEFLAGAGRTWQDVTASRSAGVTYTNNTGRDIVVNARSTASSSNGVTIYVDGINLGPNTFSASSGTSSNRNIVPSGSTYYVIFSSSDVLTWYELR